MEILRPLGMTDDMWVFLSEDDEFNKAVNILETKVGEIFPPKENIFNAFKNCSHPRDIRVMIFAQDPYPNIDAHGFAISQNPLSNRTTPPTLVTILKTLKKQGFIDQDHKGTTLELWSCKGIILLNTYLTIQADKKPHTFWLAYTRRLVQKIARLNSVIFLLWGNVASKLLEKTILTSNKNSLILKTTHPSPLAQNSLKEVDKFYNINHFKICSEIIGDDNLWKL